MSQGIDYAGRYSTVNRNSETGIRYGVISTHALHEWFYEAQEMDYGEACQIILDSSECFPDEAQGWHIDDGAYKVIDCLDSDAMVISSPYFTYAQFCSPCVPGACSMDSPVDPADIDATTAKCYCFGHDWFDSGRVVD